MAKADIAALLALGAAFFIAIGDVIHQRSAHEVTDEQVNHLELFTRLLRDRQWWLGSLVAAAGFALQAAALGLGSVLLCRRSGDLASVRAAHQRTVDHRRVTRWEWLWAALLAAAVVVIVTVGNPTAGHARASLETWTAVVACSGPRWCCACSAPASSEGPRARCCWVVSGALWGVFAVLTKGVVDRLDDGLWAMIRTPELYVWALVGDRGHGISAVVVPGRFVDGIPADHDGRRAGGRSVLGVVVLGEALRPGDAGWFTLVVAVAAMVIATAALARGEAATASAEQPA